MKTDHFDDPSGAAMEALRKLGLRSRLPLIYDSLIHQASAMRCITIARALPAVLADPGCELIIRESGLMQCLREDAVARSAGGAVALPPLLPEVQSRSQEVSNAG